MRTFPILVALATTTPALAATGGPDAFGYTYIDSDEAAGPAYVFEDISATGTPLGLSDDSHLFVTLTGFSFPFYSGLYDGIAIGSNGNIAFIDDYLGLANTCPMPGTVSYTPQALIAPYWDDLNPSSGGEVYYEEKTGPNRMIVQWDAVPTFADPASSLTFQAVLFEDGTIHLAYDSMTYTGDSASVGIQEDASVGLQYLDCNTAGTLADGLLIEFSQGVCASTDDDGDGFNACVDCDDTDATTNPGAFEIPGDGIDNDCDGSTDFSLDIDPGIVIGDSVTFNVTGAYPNANVYVARSTVGGATGSDAGPCPQVLQGSCVDIVQPTLMFNGTADANGEASFTVTIPGTVPSGVDAYFQAISAGGPVIQESAVVVETTTF